MRISIRRQISIVFITLVAVIFMSNWLINNVFLQRYYVANKQEALQDFYEQFNDIVIEYGSVENIPFNDFIVPEGADWNGPLIEISRTSNRQNIVMVGRTADNSGRFTIGRTGDSPGQMLEERLIEYMYGVAEVQEDIILATEDYQIYQYNDSDTEETYLELYGQFDDGSYFLMQSSVDSLEESVAVANQFLVYVGIIILILSILIINFLSQRLTRPIMELVGISERMIQLDFDAKYTSGGKNELGILGNNFNQMSEKLEVTISELKTVNNQLIQDIEQKEQIDEMRREFLANVSHELKTPISLIQGYAEGLREGIADDKESRDFYCEVIMDEADKMNKMVKNLLSLDQLESDSDITMERFDIIALIQGVLQSVDIKIQQEEARIVFDCPEPVYVWADEFRIEEVVMNYISNALNHLAGEKIIEIRVLRQQDCVRVYVFNTGQPIPEEDIDKVWEKFYKVDKARTREYGGNGIGLSIVKAIMDSLHKPCGVTNYANGVEFWFELDSKL